MVFVIRFVIGVRFVNGVMFWVFSNLFMIKILGGSLERRESVFKYY